MTRLIDADYSKIEERILTNMWVYVEFGFKCAEKGWNLERTAEEFSKLQLKPL